MNKTLTWMLTAVLMISVVLAGCSSTNENTGATVEGDESGPLVIRVFMQQDANTEYETNAFTQLLEEKFNIDLRFEITTTDSAAASERRKIALAGGDYPDLFMLIPWVDQFTQIEMMQYGRQGVILPLNDLIKEHAPNIQAVLDSHPYYAAMATAPDGNIYGLPQLIECYHCSYPAKMWMNRSWLEALDLQTPTTLDEFRDVLMAFKTQDPNGNGLQDEIPLSGSIAWPETLPIPYVMNAFIYDDSTTRLLLRDGQVDFAANKPEWREGLRYITSLFEDGLIDPGAFTQNAEAYLQLGNNPGVEILGAGPTMHPRVFVNDPNYDPHYDPVPPLQGSTSYAAYKFPSTPGGAFVLTNKASEEVQIAAIKLVDYLFTEEGQINGYFGAEGLDWRKPEAGEVALNEQIEPIVATIPQPSGSPPNNGRWAAAAQYYQPKEFRDAWVQGEDIYSNEGYERRLQQATDLYEGAEPDEVYPHWAVWVNPDAANEFAMLQTNIQDYVEQNALQFITGAKSLDHDWDAYIAGFDRMNLDRYLEIMQEAYDNANF